MAEKAQEEAKSTIKGADVIKNAYEDFLSYSGSFWLPSACCFAVLITMETLLYPGG